MKQPIRQTGKRFGGNRRCEVAPVILCVLALLGVLAAFGGIPVSRATDSVYGNNGTSDGNYYSMSANRLVGTIYTAPTDIGQITDAHFYARMAAGGTSVNVKFVIVLASTAVIITNGVSNPVAVTTTEQWYQVTWTTAPTLSASTNYCLMIIRDSGLYNVYLYRSSLGSSIARLDTSNNYGTPTNPTDWANQNPYYLLYCHYTPPNQAPKIDGTYIYGSAQSLWLAGNNSGYFCAGRVRVGDPDGWTDLSYVNMSYWDDTRATEYARIEYTRSSDSFALTIGSASVYFPMTGYTSSSVLVNSTARDLYWYFQTKWAFPSPALSMDFQVAAYDSLGSSATTWVEAFKSGGGEVSSYSKVHIANFTIHDHSGTTDRGSIDGEIDAEVPSGGSANLAYDDGVHYVSGSDVDFYVSCSDVSGSPWGPLVWTAGKVYADDAVGLDTYTAKVVAVGAGFGGTDLLNESTTDTYIADRIAYAITAPTYTHVGTGQNMTGVLFSATHDYDSSVANGCQLNNTVWLRSTPTACYVTGGTPSGNTHGITTYRTASGAFMAYWEGVTYTWSHFWTKYSDSLYFAHMEIVSLKWSSGGNVPDGTYARWYENGTMFANVSVLSQATNMVRSYGAAWSEDWVNWTVTFLYVSGSYNILAACYSPVFDVVPVTHTLYIEVWSLSWTDLYCYLTYGSNWHNASMTIFDNGSLVDYFAIEGVCQFALSSASGMHNISVLVNGSSPLVTGSWSAALPTNDKWTWREFIYSVSFRWSIVASFSFSDTKGHCWIDSDYAANYTIYENGLAYWVGSIPAYGSSVSWDLQTAYGTWEVGIRLIYGANSKWLNSSYTISMPASAGLYVETWSFQVDDWYVHLTVYSSWRNCSVTLIDSVWDNTQWTNRTKFFGSGEGSFDYNINQERGNHTLYVLLDGGADAMSKTVSYFWGRDYPTNQPPGLPEEFILAVAFTGIVVTLVLIGVVVLGWRGRKARESGVTVTLPTGLAPVPPAGRHRRGSQTPRPVDAQEAAYDSRTKRYDAITKKANEHG